MQTDSKKIIGIEVAPSGNSFIVLDGHRLLNNLSKEKKRTNIYQFAEARVDRATVCNVCCPCYDALAMSSSTLTYQNK
jgi:hypothetical protein